ncbi:MAG TPA: prepilin-type N-terminal cleavage/methylation domain-containing protein [Chthoniobacterales bacterium]|jgi:prepilin-type N-terminal cleavage/methylation domain-containing protein
MNHPSVAQFRSKLRRKNTRKGFSLVELLVVIAVIGIIAAIAIPNISGITQSAGTARDQRNAQNIASVSAAAIAAGYSFSGDATGTAAVADLIDGATANGTTVKLDMDPADYTTAVKGFLTYSPTTGFAYVKAGSASPAN